MVIELLTFRVDPGERDRWLAVEEEVWSRYLEGCDGFVRKEMWLPEEDPGTVRAVIWWESMGQWKAIGPEAVAEVDARMGDWLREPTSCEAYEVLRES